MNVQAEGRRTIAIVSLFDPINDRNKLVTDLVDLRTRTAGFAPTHLRPEPGRPALEYLAGSDLAACFVLADGADHMLWMQVGVAIASSVPHVVVSMEESAAIRTVAQGVEGRSIAFVNGASNAGWKTVEMRIGDFLDGLSHASDGTAPPVRPDFLARAKAPLPEPQPSQRPLAPASSWLGAAPPSLDGRCEPYELNALSVIRKRNSMGGTTLRQLGMELNRQGLAKSTSLAVNKLRRRGLIEYRTSITSSGTAGEPMLFLKGSESGVRPSFASMKNNKAEKPESADRQDSSLAL